MQQEIIHLSKKRYGQNFLNNKTILEKIQNVIPSDTLKCVEIGAGFGDLTKYLNHLSVLSFEIDLDLKQHLLKIFKKEIENKKIEFIFKDVLSIWNEHHLIDKPYQIVANLPYYVAKKIILKALMDSNCKYILVMIQKEVAQKFSAKTNDRNFSSLSVITQILCNKANILFDVEPQMFDPAPSVMSSVILFEKKENSFIENSFLDFLKVAFSSPRKKLLSGMSNKYGKDKIKNIFNELNIQENYRAHQVSANNYLDIFSKLDL
jgi:16S rRNA (adenine1518-N6/adenine1519-N6)-dimethyltransferase